MKIKKYLVLLERTNPLFPLAERLVEYEGCEYVDSIASELIDGIGKFEGSEKDVDKICKSLGIEKEGLKEIEVEILGEKKRGIIPFWIRVYVNRNEGLVERLKELKDYEEIYLTKDDFLFLRSRANSVSKICKLEDETLEYLKDWLNLEKRIVTYFVLKRFSANR